MVRRRTKGSDLQDLIDVNEDILEEVELLRKEIRPVIILAWIYLVLLVIAFIVVIVVAASAGGE